MWAAKRPSTTAIDLILSIVIYHPARLAIQNVSATANVDCANMQERPRGRLFSDPHLKAASIEMNRAQPEFLGKIGSGRRNAGTEQFRFQT